MHYIIKRMVRKKKKEKKGKYIIEELQDIEMDESDIPVHEEYVKQEKRKDFQ